MRPRDMQPFNLLATKLHRPAVPSKWVARPRLLERLNEGLALDRQVTLISAPAGFGKTTCVSAWLDELADWPVAWLSLDAADDDPGRFCAYLVAALQTVAADLGSEIEGVLRAGQLPPAEVVSTTLINDFLDVESRFMLVLDDFQVIQDAFILQVLTDLLANLPPALHLVLLTREDPPLPLARLRANNQLTEVRAGNLRFSDADTAQFLNEVMGLALSSKDVAELAAKTEGWVAGLQLAGLSVRDREDPSAFIANLSGSHRAILGYLTEQVLDQQPEEIRQFLLQTAILDKLNADLCNAVTGRSDSRALLDRLYNANLFLTPLDDTQHWYRYHQMFVDLLRDQQSQLGQANIAELHQRASRWYAQQSVNAPGASVTEAIQHALAAQDYELTVQQLETHAMDLVMQGYAKTVNGWVQAIPAEWGAHSPKTNLAFIWMYMLQGSHAQVLPHLARLEETIAGLPEHATEWRALRAEWLVIQALLRNMEGKIPESLAAAEEALEIAAPTNNRVRSLAHFGRACAYQARDDYERTVEAYQQSIQYGRASGNWIAEMMSTSGLAQLAYEHGQLHLAAEIVEPVTERLERTGSLPPICTVLYGILGDVYGQWFQLEPARQAIQRALQLSTLGGFNSGIVNCRVLRSRLELLAGNIEAADQDVQDALALMRVDAPDYVRQETAAQQVRVLLSRNRPGAAELALQAFGFSFRDGFSYPTLPKVQNNTHSIGMLYTSSLHVLLHQAQANGAPSDLQTGITLADDLLRGALDNGYVPIALQTLLLRAQLHALLEGHPASQADYDYAQALELGASEGFIGVFVEQGAPVAEALAELATSKSKHRDYIARILAAFSGLQTLATTDHKPPSAQAPSSELIDPLTERELDVLGLMAEGLTYKEIAARLFVSVNTVRYHVKALYAKLNANNRTQAIETARQLQIL
ncbi:MAG: hypothetical protein JXB38_13225 [Anaerolineales bacterium]|nr:hypothetical protein [Anaerolineales bacterium]